MILWAAKQRDQDRRKWACSLKADLKASNIFRRNPFATPYFVLSSSYSIFASLDIKLSYHRIFGGVTPHTNPPVSRVVDHPKFWPEINLEIRGGPAPRFSAKQIRAQQVACPGRPLSKSSSTLMYVVPPPSNMIGILTTLLKLPAASPH